MPEEKRGVWNPLPGVKEIDLRQGDRVDRAIDEAKAAFCAAWPWFFQQWTAAPGVFPVAILGDLERVMRMLPDAPFEAACQAFLGRLTLQMEGDQ